MELEDLRKLESLLQEYKAAYPDDPYIHEAWLQLSDRLCDEDPEYH